MLPLASAVSRLGTETAFEVLARAKALEARGKSVINLGIGQPDFPTPPHIVEAAVKALRDGHHGYTPANGIPELREAVAARLEKRAGAPLDPERVIAVPGGKVTMFFAITMFGEPGAEILYPNPGFPIYESVIRYSGATPVPLPLHESKGFAFSSSCLCFSFSSLLSRSPRSRTTTWSSSPRSIGWSMRCAAMTGTTSPTRG